MGGPPRGRRGTRATSGWPLPTVPGHRPLHRLISPPYDSQVSGVPGHRSLRAPMKLRLRRQTRAPPHQSCTLHRLPGQMTRMITGSLHTVSPATVGATLPRSQLAGFPGWFGNMRHMGCQSAVSKPAGRSGATDPTRQTGGSAPAGQARVVADRPEAGLTHGRGTGVLGTWCPPGYPPADRRPGAVLP